jgi:adenylyltransferase/sulfurtransferase
MMAVSEIGSSGLEKLSKSKVALVGLGGVGSATGPALAKSGVGYIRLIDQDIVEPSNLHRLQGVGPDSLYRPKAEVAAKVLAAANPWTKLEPIVETLRANNAEDLLDGVDLIIDCLDNFRTRYIVNEYSHQAGIPFLFTSAVANQGHVALFQPPETPCLECAMPNMVDRDEESCEALGVTPSVVGLVGSIATSEASKLLLGLPSELRGRLLTIDTMGPDFIISDISKDPSCEACNGRGRDTQVSQKTPTMLCGARTANLLPKDSLNLDLTSLSERVPRGDILSSSDVVLVYTMRGLTVSLFRTGRVLVDGVREEHDAQRIAEEIWGWATRESASARDLLSVR